MRQSAVAGQVRLPLLDVTPRPPADECRPYARGLCRTEIIVEPVTDVDDLPGVARRGPEISRKNAGSGLAAFQSSDWRSCQRAGPACGGFRPAGCLVARHADPYAHGPQPGHVGRASGYMSLSANVSGWPAFRALFTLSSKVKTGPEILECVTVIHFQGDYRADTAEMRAWAREPVGPRPVPGVSSQGSHRHRIQPPRSPENPTWPMADRRHAPPSDYRSILVRVMGGPMPGRTSWALVELSCCGRPRFKAPENMLAARCVKRLRNLSRHSGWRGGWMRRCSMRCARRSSISVRPGAILVCCRKARLTTLLACTPGSNRPAISTREMQAERIRQAASEAEAMVFRHVVPAPPGE